MATAANSATISHSPQSSSNGSFLTGHQSKDSTAVRDVSAPWTQMVRGSKSEILCPPSSDMSPSMADVTGSPSSIVLSTDESGMEATPESSDVCSGSSKAAGKKPAWNKPLGGAVEDGPVMDAESWPALSLSTKALSKSGSSDSLKVVSDGLTPKFQNVTNNANASSRSNEASSLQKFDHGGESSSGTITDNGSFLPPLSLQQGLVVETSPNAGNLGSPVVEASSSNENTHHMESGKRVGLGSQPNSEQQQQQQQYRGSFRRGSGGSNHYHHNHVGRRDQERGNRDWNRNRSFSGRDSRGYVRAPPHDTPFIPPPPGPLRPPYGSPMVYQAAPVVYPMPPPLMFFPAPEPLLHSRILNQIEYYFSYDNLVKDTYLRQNMDELGWVPIKLIAGFKKVRLLTDNIQLILGVLRLSSVVEVQGDKVRKRNDWWKWTMQQPSSVQFPDNMQTFGREERTAMTAAAAERMDGRAYVLNRGF